MTEWRNQDPAGYDGYATRPRLWRPLERAIGGFDTDPAAGTEPAPIADTVFTPEDDGLARAWPGTVWLNPPFSDKERWYRRLINQLRNGPATGAVAVAPADPSTEWFHRWFSRCDYLALLEGRDWFIRNPGEGGSPSYSTMIGVWDLPDALEPLEDMGQVYQPTHRETISLEADYD